MARVHSQLPNAKLPLSQRHAQLVIAREYGFSGWKDLLKEVERRLGGGLAWAVSESRRVIHDNDIEGLRQLVAEYPALLSWRSEIEDGGLLGMATGSFGDSFDAFREEHFTRRACAEFLIDAGAIVTPSVCDNLIRSRARRLIDLFHRKGLFPRTLKFHAALGDLEAVRSCLAANSVDLHTVNEALQFACHLQHAEVAALLLNRSIALDAELGRRAGSAAARSALIQYFMENKPEVHVPGPFHPWQARARQQVQRAMEEGDVRSFVDRLREEPWMLSGASLDFQVRLIEWMATSRDHGVQLLQAFLIWIPRFCIAPLRRAPGRSHTPSHTPIAACCRCCSGSGLFPAICRTPRGLATWPA